MRATLDPVMRYPGSKAKLVGVLNPLFAHEVFFPLAGASGWTYAEPFLGAGAMAANVIPDLTSPEQTHIWLNDKDLWLVCFWQSILQEPEALCDLVSAFEPTAHAFYTFKEQDGEKIDPVQAGFRKLALHQISFSGLGYMAGGPLGGKAQNNSQYTPGCRWRPERLTRRIRHWHKRLARFDTVHITARDFSDVLGGLPNRSLVYLDPPYVVKGAQLYKHSMALPDHERLASLLRTASFEWVLSYDDCGLVRDLYSGWTTIRETPIKYTIPTAKVPTRRKNHEVVITPRTSNLPNQGERK